MVLMPISQAFNSTLSVSDTPVLLASKQVLSNLYSGRHTVEVFNNGASQVFIGGSDVTVDNGIPLGAGAVRAFPVDDKHALYVVAEQDTTVVLAEYC